ncbi:DUF4124 domain-containing protein [Acinetobacter bereziniae]|jgi:hypothetical protein|uniref:DUF4124 domain-containing protein n=1 Tax=Acinetobacter TaxID=469 RepID=UPI0006298079|nr:MULTISPECIES: DUF4124 domain-containing protein [Acinetobacter]KKW81988.1 hypothetical protein AAV97_00335 [Acinetobacter sp. Ag2]MBJ8422001.1 DUF4124 domain-containing protein [Acinetobacter bereziniae]MBO3655644.1 DUF4124 domain-containing protein [Acinetobacter bereziniae]MCU4317032.1 DUF4124 domain-containing protein [Acinetobacter bereziniae]MCU4419322.1 DUF4124 domain-containing protein [Acinetobacter bereziniae]
MKQHQRFTHTVFVSTIFALLSVTTATSHAKQYYKWVDSNGSTHYTTTPPPKNARNKTKVDTYGYRGTPSPTNQPTAQQTAPQNNPSNTQQNAPQNGQPVNNVPVVNPPQLQQPTVIPQNNTNSDSTLR